MKICCILDSYHVYKETIPCLIMIIYNTNIKMNNLKKRGREEKREFVNIYYISYTYFHIICFPL